MSMSTRVQISRGTEKFFNALFPLSLVFVGWNEGLINYMTPSDFSELVECFGGHLKPAVPYVQHRTKPILYLRKNEWGYLPLGGCIGYPMHKP